MTAAVNPDLSGVPRRRGRPRSPAARAAILRAARALLREGGTGAVTMEAVAARAGVGKPTVYRWWPDRHALAMAALMEGSRASAPAAASRSPLRALRRQLRDTAAAFATPTGRTVAAMIAASDPDTELARAFRTHFVLARREEGRALLEAAAARGELRRDAHVETAVDLIYGGLFFRLLMGHAQLDARFAEAALDAVLAGVAATRAPKRRARPR